MSSTQPTTRLQGAIPITATFTIRVTYDPTGAATTHDFTVYETAVFQSIDAFLAVWQAALGVGWNLQSIPGTGTGTTRITSPGLNFSVEWSFSGFGGDLRNNLGFTGNLADVASPTNSPNPQGCAFYPGLGAVRAVRTATKRPGMHAMTLNAASRMQSSPAPGDGDASELDIELWTGVSAMDELGAFEQFLLGLDAYSDHCRFTLTHGDESWFVRLGGAETRIEATRATRCETPWRLRFKAEFAEVA